MDSLVEGLLVAVSDAFGLQGFLTMATIGLVSLVFGPRQGLVLTLGCLTFWGVAERDSYFFYEERLPVRHLERSSSLVEQLGDAERAERAEAILTGRRRQVGARALLEEAMVAPGTSTDESRGVSPYRRMARILANDEGRDRSWAVEAPYRFLTRQLEATEDSARRAILWELLFATGDDEVARIWRDHESDPEIELPALRGLTAALRKERPSRRLRRELILPLAMRLAGEPASDDLRDPGPAAILIRILGVEATKHLVTAEVLDPANPRLAENLRAMTEGRLLLPLSTHEALIGRLGERGGDPAAAEALQEAIAMLGLRGDIATRARLVELKRSAETRDGAERGLQILDREVESR